MTPSRLKRLALELTKGKVDVCPEDLAKMTGGELLHEIGCEKVGIVLCEQVVFKFGRAAVVEAEAYRDAPAKAKRFLVPCVQVGEDVSVMERVTTTRGISPVSSEWDDICPYLIGACRKQVSESGMDFSDIHYDNVGVSKRGDPVLLDYTYMQRREW